MIHATGLKLKIVSVIQARARLGLTGEVFSLLQSYYYFPSSVPLFHDPNSISSITQTVAPIDDRFQFPAHDEFAQQGQIFLT